MRSAILAGAFVGLAVLVYRSLRYDAFVPHSELRRRWAALPDVKRREACR